MCSIIYEIETASLNNQIILNVLLNNTFTKRNIIVFTSHVTEVVCFSGGERSGCGVTHTSPSSAEVKERVELYLYSPLWPFMACYRVNFDPYYECELDVTSCTLVDGQFFYWGISSCKWILKSEILSSVQHNLDMLLQYKTLKCTRVLPQWGWVWCSVSQANQCERHRPPELEIV
jgi:hypothetical protein